jgi:hypothetical protein
MSANAKITIPFDICLQGKLLQALWQISMGHLGASMFALANTLSGPVEAKWSMIFSLCLLMASSPTRKNNYKPLLM